MSDEVSMSLDIEDFTRQLQSLEAATSGRVLKTAITAAALIVQNDAKRIAPYVTGNLRRSIHIEVEQPSRFVANGFIGTNLDYARRVEYGFAGADVLGRIYNQPAKPYLRPAMDNNRAAVLEEFREVLILGLAAAGV